ncbi:MAG: ATP-grasp domain-containing protein [Ignavibacteriales bacterium]|nr:hypothetical protein [Ignavibacteriaceae bacterium]MBW7874317.1 ATP-grasp domain-containing protein [Ignavibacteria bacterium]MBZ0196121.1 ATP-grasp domain-containing protein [Ignavibacteriaceae bacterium]MCZ2142508.1 ATP-grasp domain-containing protein [Ignavibacteriales bacterium]WKZ72825.1 MAG: ATP-grasp domain-containing protein [Ignavibacteriaceae bacterium]
MSEITVLVTGAGAPGIAGTVYSLWQNYDGRHFRIVGTDMKDDVIGRFLCDAFYTIPPVAERSEYLARLLEVCAVERVAILIPQNTAELEVLAEELPAFEDLGVKLLLAGVKGIKSANNKYELLRVAQRLGVAAGNFALARSFDSFLEAAKSFGWPHKRVVAKLPVSNGMRGLRIIDEGLDELSLFLMEKPTAVFVKMDYFRALFDRGLAELVVCGFLPGDEYSVDIFRNKEVSVILPRKRLAIRSGISFDTVFEQNRDIINFSATLSEELELVNCFGFQFKLDEEGAPVLLECNPRVQGTMVASLFANQNIIYHGIKNLLGEQIKVPETDWNARFMRYWGGVGINEKGSIWV